MIRCFHSVIVDDYVIIYLRDGLLLKSTAKTQKLVKLSSSPS